MMKSSFSVPVKNTRMISIMIKAVMTYEEIHTPLDSRGVKLKTKMIGSLKKANM